MILILAYWKSGRVWALIWMIPLMIIWSNVHGGFIYAIMIFVIALSGYLVQQYAGKASYPLALLGFAIGFILLLIGGAGLPEHMDNVKRLFAAKQVMLERYYDLMPGLIIHPLLAARYPALSLIHLLRTPLLTIIYYRTAETASISTNSWARC